MGVAARVWLKLCQTTGPGRQTETSAPGGTVDPLPMQQIQASPGSPATTAETVTTSTYACLYFPQDGYVGGGIGQLLASLLCGWCVTNGLSCRTDGKPRVACGPGCLFSQLLGLLHPTPGYCMLEPILTCTSATVVSEHRQVAWFEYEVIVTESIVSADGYVSTPNDLSFSIFMRMSERSEVQGPLTLLLEGTPEVCLAYAVRQVEADQQMEETSDPLPDVPIPRSP